MLILEETKSGFRARRGDGWVELEDLWVGQTPKTAFLKDGNVLLEAIRVFLLFSSESFEVRGGAGEGCLYIGYGEAPLMVERDNYSTVIFSILAEESKVQVGRETSEAKKCSIMLRMVGGSLESVFPEVTTYDMVALSEFSYFSNVRESLV
jgi:hypothetical protein